MRVVAGSAGGIPLHTPKSDLRPTMDVVKGAIFSSLADLVAGARVLDLFAGAGGLGIEALSRGADSATFVESNRLATESIEKNLTKTRLKGSVQQMDVFRFLDRCTTPELFDLILADPPYAKQRGDRDFTPELLGNEFLRRSIASDGIFVLEHKPGDKLFLHERWELIRQKRYGATEVAFLRPI